MSFPNLSSRTTKLIYPSFQDDLDQAPWDSYRQQDDANYEQLYKRVPVRSNSNKMFTQEKRGLSYIDKSISLCAPSDPTVLNNKLQKFFKTLTKNYKPVTSRSRDKSPRGTPQTNRQEEGYSPSKYTQNRGSPLMMKKGYSQGQKSYSHGIIDNERPLSSNEDEEELILARGGVENMYGQFPAQESRHNETRDYRQYENSVSMSTMRSLSNPTRQSQEGKTMMELGGRSTTRMSNVSTQDQSVLPHFNESPIAEDNCNYAYLKSFPKQSDGIHPYQRFLVQEESQQDELNPNFKGHNPVYIPRKTGGRETASQSQSSSLKNLDPNQHNNMNHSKKSSKVVDNRKKEVYSSQGSPLISYHFSERDDECEPYRPSIAMPGVAGVYSSMHSEGKDENPNYTDVKLIGSQIIAHNEIRNEQMLSFAKKASNFGNTLQQSSEDNKLRTMSQVTDMLDSTEDMFIKQKGCFNMFLAMNKIVFKRINSVFQDIKRGPLHLREVSHGNFVSFGEGARQESTGLNKALARYQTENSQGLNVILQGLAKISGMVNAIDIATHRTKQSGFERIANHGTVNQVVYKDRFITGFLLLFAIEKSQRRSLVSQSFNTWATNFKMQKLRETEASKFQQIVQMLSQEKQKLQEELNSAREKSSPVMKANPPQKDLKFFLQSMEAPGGQLKVRKDSNDSKPSSTNTTLTNRQEEAPVKNVWGERSPLASRLQGSNKVSEDQDPIKMFNGAIKRAFEHDSAKQMRSKSMFGHEFANSAQKPIQENNRYVDTRRNEPENCPSPPQNYIDTLKRQSKLTYEKILSPSSQNYYESRGIELESSKGSRGDLNTKNHLGRAILGFGVSPPKELTEEDEFTAESIRKGETVKLVQREFFESLERFDHANVDDTYDVDQQQKDSMTIDQSEIMKERTGDTRSIRDILARGLITRNFEESMVASDGEQSFYKNGMENVMILKRAGI